MTDAVRLLALAVGAMVVIYAGLGYEATYAITYGAFALMAAMVSLTFMWLWRVRATPLAGGMAFSWAGASSVIGWWWAYSYLNHPALMFENAAFFVCLAIYFVGALMHFAVIGRSLGVRRPLWTAPVAGALAISTFLYLLKIW
ncbi:MAG: hypothetical protein KJO42_04065 [Silicimonas sp.]|nr:hypothetical protein [Silicimonas sp.]NNF89926.1 hypothetical protein [Boseongicola sp.]